MGNEILDNGSVLEVSNTDNGIQKRLPKDSSILTTGIIALPFSFGLVGIILSIVTLVNASKALQEYTSNPNGYLESSVKKVRSGRVCAIVSLSLFGVGILVVMTYFATN